MREDRKPDRPEHQADFRVRELQAVDNQGKEADGNSPSRRTIAAGIFAGSVYPKG
jgi:hypothetical protein